MKKSELRKIIKEAIRDIYPSRKINVIPPKPIKGYKPKKGEILEEGPFSARKVWATMCDLPGVGLHPGGGTPAYGLSLNFNDIYVGKMTINGNKPNVGDIFRNSPSVSGNAQSGGDDRYYRVTDTGAWTMGTTVNYPAGSESGNCKDDISYPNQFVCGWEKSSQNVHPNGLVNFKNGGVKSCHEVPNEIVVEDYIRAGVWWPQDASGWDNNDPSTWTLRQFGGGNPAQQIGVSPPILDWWVFFNNINECKTYCGAWDNQFGGTGGTFGCMDELWGVPMVQPGCVPSYPWDMQAYPYSNISACQINCVHDDFESDYPNFDGDRFMCDGSGGCAPCDYTQVTNGANGNWYGSAMTYGPCKFGNEQDCLDAQGTPDGCDYPENPKFRCGHCNVNTPCTQAQIDNNPGVCVFDNVTDCSAYCQSTTFFGNEYFKCPRPDKFGNISPNCLPCTAYEVLLSINAQQPNSPSYIAGANDPGCTNLQACQDKINQGICDQGKIKLAPGEKGITNEPSSFDNDVLSKVLNPDDEIGTLDIEPEIEPELRDLETEPIIEPVSEPESDQIGGCTHDGDCVKGQSCVNGICVDGGMIEPEVPEIPEDPIDLPPLDKALRERMQKIANIKFKKK